MNDDDPVGQGETDPATLSRRGLLANGLAAAAGGIAALTAAAAQADTSPAPAPAPAPARGRRGAPARKFRAWISRGEGAGRTTLQEVTLLPIKGRQVVVRTEATNLCYFVASAVLGVRAPLPADAPAAMRAMRAKVDGMAMIQGHGGIGVVEAVGPDVRRVKPGDRVCVSGTPQCGVCYQCLRGRSDMCQFLGPAQNPDNLTVIAQMRDGTPVYANSEIGGLAELMVTYEEWVVPVMSRATTADLGTVCSCVSIAGLGATTSQGTAILPPGATTAVVGCGPLGLSAVQGARIAGASTIIAIDPIAARRDVARRLGASVVLDPNEEGDRLVRRVQELSMRDNPSVWGGGHGTGMFGGGGADYVVEAVGAEWVRPKAEACADPTGVVAIQQAYGMVTAGGHLVTTSVASGMVSFPAALFNIGGRTHHAGQAGGCSPLRDIPRFVSLLDSGRYDPAAMRTAVVPFEQVVEAYPEVIYRTTVFALMVV
jgi:S-(hydroxymethyl)glutathione dehydrogenase/alcohol dehydrogenase